MNSSFNVSHFSDYGLVSTAIDIPYSSWAPYIRFVNLISKFLSPCPTTYSFLSISALFRLLRRILKTCF